MQLPSFPFVILDTETTGFVPRVHRIIEFASVRVEKGAIVDTYDQLFATKEIPPVVQALTRIRPADLAGKPTVLEKKEEILEHIGRDTVIVGQNISYDLAMLKGEGIDLTDRHWIDTSMLASIVFPELESYSLGYLSKALELEHMPPHRALGDVRATMGLLAVCYERFLEVPSDLQEIGQIIMQRSSPGYRAFFDALPEPKKKKAPKWLQKHILEGKEVGSGTARPNDSVGRVIPKLPKPDKGTVELIEETLEPNVLDHLIAAALRDEQTTHWIAVKNLEATVYRRKFPKGVRVLHPPFLLPDRDAVKRFAQQETYTEDEATLAIKLAWYEPAVRSDFPLHGSEDAVWSAKIACTEASPTYLEQFHDLPTVVLLDHRQLLTFLADPNHPAHEVLGKDSHIVITDASMLEDTATKAYGWYAGVDDLRAGAVGHPLLTKFVDLLQLWVEKTRHFQDLRYVTKGDLTTPETKGLRDQLEVLVEEKLPPRIDLMLRALADFLEPEALGDRIAWIETRQNGSQSLQSVPDRIGNLLKQHLYGQFSTSLLIPAESSETHKEIIPLGTTTRTSQLALPPLQTPIHFPEESSLETYLTDPPRGKTVLLIPSKSAIEDMFVKHVERLEAQGVTLICQGTSGGQGRMQAEFQASRAPVLWLMTPWTFEGIDLMPQTIDHLVLQTLPFDHPSHAVLSKRAHHFRNAFEEYSLARLEHRLFRLLRTFSRFRTKKGDVSVLDERIRSKDYGKRVARYLEHFASGAVEEKEPRPAKKIPALKKKKGEEGQLSLF
ncbi:hypothetical protein HYZ99_03810 [Candidatus Peregrinibacteria bacterium]|nr:hypothetical protein [Candidatus Peregrinibacteria bacterium]